MKGRKGKMEVLPRDGGEINWRRNHTGSLETTSMPMSSLLSDIHIQRWSMSLRSARQACTKLVLHIWSHENCKQPCTGQFSWLARKQLCSERAVDKKTKQSELIWVAELYSQCVILINASSVWACLCLCSEAITQHGIGLKGAHRRWLAKWCLWITMEEIGSPTGRSAPDKYQRQGRWHHWS